MTKQRLSELGYHHPPRRGFAATVLIDLIGIVAVFGFAVIIGYLVR